MTIQQNNSSLNIFSRTVMQAGLYPGTFFTEMSQAGKYTQPVYFLIISATVNAVLSALLVPSSTPATIVLYFVNAIGMPLVMASLLFGITHILFRGSFEQFRTLFSITAYANVTYLFSWVPGFSWVAGLWNFYLIGVGLVKAGRISGLKAFLCILIALAILASLLQYLQVQDFSALPLG
ncbi:MAG: hypothetical protein BWK80_48660 [Desulfobacteraceae bacterium IS3]|nr:MAG: hypothetical protein BWK80_48660 [Desulfobacteraceae bacterium IS3]